MYIIAVGAQPNPATIEAWALAHKEPSLLPNDLDTMFVVEIYLDLDQHEAQMCIVLSTRRLLDSAPSTIPMIHNDDTNGMLWQQFPVMLTGFTDAGRAFKLLCISICTKKDQWAYEKITQAIKARRPDFQFKFSMSDAAQAIFNGVHAIYGGIVQFMCWMHVFIKNALKVFNILFWLFHTLSHLFQTHHPSALRNLLHRRH